MVMNKTLFEKWHTQLRKGYLELCVLQIVLQKQKTYGLEILLILKAAHIKVNEGTLYPLLNRMNKNDWLKSAWDTQTESGHPRRFYQLSTTGKQLLPIMLETYKENHHAFNLLEKK